LTSLHHKRGRTGYSLALGEGPGSGHKGKMGRLSIEIETSCEGYAVKKKLLVKAWQGLFGVDLGQKKKLQGKRQVRAGFGVRTGLTFFRS